VLTITTTVPSGSLTVKSTMRQGVAYLIFGGTPELTLTNKTYTLPQVQPPPDCRKRDQPACSRAWFRLAFEANQPGNTDRVPAGFIVDFDPGSTQIADADQSTTLPVAQSRQVGRRITSPPADTS
jgi:hypothetical protein